MTTREAQLDAMSYSDLTAVMRRIMPDLYFVNTPVAQMRLHLKLLAQLAEESLLLDFRQHRTSNVTEFTLCGYNDEQPGLLSSVCGTLTALGVDIQTAFIYSLRLPGDTQQLLSVRGKRPPSGRRAVLDTLFVSEPYIGRHRALTTATVRRVREELASILSGKMTVEQLAAKRRRRPFPPLRIDQISVRNPEMSGQTVITLRAQDEPGVLYRTTAALAALDLHIDVAQVDTADGAVQDIFYVTGANDQALPETELRTLGRRLRTMLQESDARIED